jgi:hypothetical protein
MSEKKRPTTEDFEAAINKAIGAVPGVGDMDEHEYCEVVGGALDSILTGVNMRQQELAEEDDD